MMDEDVEELLIKSAKTCLHDMKLGGITRSIEDRLKMEKYLGRLQHRAEKKGSFRWTFVLLFGAMLGWIAVVFPATT